MRHSNTYKTLQEADATVLFYSDVAVKLEYLRNRVQAEHRPAPEGAKGIPDSVTNKICNAVTVLDEALEEIDKALGNSVRAKLRLSKEEMK